MYGCTRGPSCVHEARLTGLPWRWSYRRSSLLTFETNALIFLKWMLNRGVAQPPWHMTFNSISKAKYSKLMDKKMRYGNSASCAIAKTYVWRTWSFTYIWCCAGHDSRQWPVCISSQQHHPRLQDLHHGPGRAYTRRHAFGKAVNAHAREDVWLWLCPEPGAACFAADLISQDLITAELFTDTLARPGLSEFLERRDCESYFLPESGRSQRQKANCLASFTDCNSFGKAS